MGKFNGKISAEFTPPKTWKLEKTLSFAMDDLTKAEIRAKQKECAERGTRASREFKERWWFSLKTCQCESKRGKIQDRLDDTKELIANCPRPKFNKKGSFIGCEGSDGGYAPKFTTEMN